MPIIQIDGPERSGKSTIASAIGRLYGARVRHWGPVDPDDRVYSPAMEQDIASGDLVVWDRSWAAEHVYGKLLNRDRRLARDPWLGEWIHGRAVRTVGVQCILLGPSSLELDKLRDASGLAELPVDADVERDSFAAYGERFNYLVIENGHTENEAERWADALVNIARTVDAKVKLNPPGYCGPPEPNVVFVGERKGDHPTIPGGWLPFSSRLGAMLGRDLGDFAFACGWTNSQDIQPQFLRDVLCLVALGQVAAKWVDHYVHPTHQYEVLDHPGYIYRWGKQSDRLVEHRDKLGEITTLWA